MRVTRFVSLLVLVAVALVMPYSYSSAKGSAAKVLLSGPGIKQTVEIADRQTLDALGLGALEDLNRKLSIDMLPSLGAGYDLVRYLQEPDAPAVAFDRIRVFPNASDGHSYIFYAGLLLNDSWSEFDGKWLPVRPEAEAVLQKLLAKYVSASSSPTDLAVLPQSCKASSRLNASLDFPTSTLRLTPEVGMTGFTGTEASLKLVPESSGAHPTKHGWTYDARLIVNPKLYEAVNVWAANIEDSAPVWFQLSGHDPSTVVSLDRQALSTMKQTNGWIEVPVTLYLPEAGCYQFEAYSGRSLSKTAFAAGR